MTIKSLAIAAAAGVAILGTAGAAYAATTSPSTPSTPSPSASSGSTSGSTSGSSAGHHRRGHFDLASIAHGQFVRHDKRTGQDVTYDVIRGDVTAVSPTAITVKAADGTTASYSVSSATKVRSGKTASSIAQVKTGDQAMVIGTGTSNFAAMQILVHS